MSTTDHPEHEGGLALEQAMDWFMRLRDTPCEEDVVRQWEAWLRESEKHAAAWTRICRTWVALGERPAPLPSARPPLAPTASFVQRAGKERPFSRRRFGLTGAALLCLSLAVIFFGTDLLLRFEADFRTGAGETLTTTLADGSRVTLAPESALSDAFDGTNRKVRLLEGEAYFEVTHDTTRPFVVTARDASVRVLGTAFSVRDTGHGTRVELARGAVELRWTDATGDTAMALAPGDAVTVDRSNGKADRSRVDPHDIALWREGRLSVTDQTLGDVVGLIQRQHPAWIVVAEADISALRVTGLYDLNDPDKALAALIAPFNLHLRPFSPYLRVISSR
ncbi:FecR family protein [Rhizobium straminoryzae]|uniref:FecR family protein n=2 Tax=Rhizobium straminoryzae TaxID=1387186 RepID=A0A549TFI3_9HYPH|nr:FecR family protein [Rhizobium straminoryzae]